MIRWKSLVFCLFLLVLFLLYFFHAFVMLDSDFGWHLRMGQLILHHGIPLTDPFSYSMPHYPFVDHEWLSDVLLAVLYSWVGYLGLAVFFALLVVFSLLLVSGRLASSWHYFFFFLGGLAIMGAAGIRVQVIGWLFFAFTLRLVMNRTLWHTWKYFLPFLFLLWANMHGSFALGIGLVFCFLFFHWRRLSWVDWLIGIFCIGVTFLNPYGARMWWEVAVSVFDIRLRDRVAEWQSVFQFVLPGFWLFLAFTVLLFVYRTYFSSFEKILFIFFLLFSVEAVRNIPFWIFLMLPLLFRSFALLRTQTLRFPGGGRRLVISSIVLAVMIGTVSFWQGILLYQQTISFQESTFYPEGVVFYLRKHLPQHQIFSIYDWGGYLLWKIPERKVFIDGRMPSWRWKAPKGESDDAYAEFLQVFGGEVSVKHVLQKYSIDAFVFPTTFSDTQPIPSKTDRLLSFFFPGQQVKRKVPSFFDQIRVLGFRKVYQDHVATLWERD